MRTPARKAALVAGLALALAAAPAAFARGGGSTSSGGVNSGGVNSGGVNSGGGGSSAPCATFASASATVGYYSAWAALWNNFTIKSCATSGGPQTYILRIRDIDTTGAAATYDISLSYSLSPGANAGGVLDNDFAAFSTPYDVEYSISAADGTVLATWSTLATTPAPKTGGGTVA